MPSSPPRVVSGSTTALDERADYITGIAADDPMAAERQRNRIIAAAGLLLEYPQIGAPWRGSRRRGSVPGTPITLYYRITRNAIQISYARHQARRPLR